jgi:hypothetical protein
MDIWNMKWAASWQNQHSAFATSMDPVQPAHPRSLIRIHAVRLPNLLQLEEHGTRSDCADAQAGLDPCWSQSHYVGFVVTWLKYWKCVHWDQEHCTIICPPIIKRLFCSNAISKQLSNRFKKSTLCIVHNE